MKSFKIKENLKFAHSAITSYLLLKDVPQINTFDFRDRISSKYSFEYNIYPFIYKNLDYIGEFINSDDDNLKEKIIELGYAESTADLYMKGLSEKEITLTYDKLKEIFITNVNKVNNIYDLIKDLDPDDKQGLIAKILYEQGMNRYKDLIAKKLN